MSAHKLVNLGLMPAVALRLLLLLLCVLRGESVIPFGQLQLRYHTWTLPFSPALGSEAKLPRVEDAEYQRLILPRHGEIGCESTISLSNSLPNSAKFVILLERGECAYYRKALIAQRAGASGVLIANTVRGVYGTRGHALISDVNCEAGSGWLPKARVLNPAYLPAMRDRMPAECTEDKRCMSHQCLLTNITNPSTGDIKTCCAWDLWDEINLKSEGVSESIKIPVGFLRMEDTERLLRVPSLPNGLLDVSM